MMTSATFDCCPKGRIAIMLMVAVASTHAFDAVAATRKAHDSAQRLYVDRDSSDIHHALSKLKGRDRANALLIARFPIAVWFSGGTPAEVQARVKSVVAVASNKQQIPVVVAYNIPFRDCQQYSSGGAADTAAYQAWIDGFASGIGKRRAIVVLEPDSLGIIPHFTTIAGQKEWCQPAKADAARAAEQRFAQLNYAVDKLKALDNVRVYLDGTHSAWLDAGDIARRLVRAGVQRADGFFLNVANYQPTSQLLRYGSWVSKCIRYGTATLDKGDLARFKACASHVSPESHEAATDNSEALHSETLHTETLQRVDEWYARNVDTKKPSANAKALRHFIIDTSRNGRGAWTPPAGKYNDAQAWCNPPQRGLGERPALSTAHALLDGKLWIKVPGESDGSCTRGALGSDPERGMVDPPAGKWFKEQAAELIEFAVPPVAR